MLRPDKYMNPDISVISISAEILTVLKKERIIRYSDLTEAIIRTKGEKSKVIFLPSINFLFLLDKISYIKEADKIMLKNYEAF